MAFDLLDALLAVLAGDEGVSGLVDAGIHKFLPLEKSEALLKSGNRSMISCELQDWDGRNSSTEPVFVVDIRSRKGDDRGAEYCSEIVSAVTELLRDGFGGLQISKILGTVRYDKTMVGHRCRLAIYGHIQPSISLSLAVSPVSPQAAGSAIILVATANPAEGLEYRFQLLGPGTGSAWRDLSGWISRNSFSWRPEAADAGSSTIRVEVRSGRSLPDAEASISYAITAESTNELPVISSLTSSLSSPRGQGTKIDFICQAADADGDPIYYRFHLIGPGTALKKKMVQDWSQKNAWSWTPQAVDVGVNTIEVQIRDGNHAGSGGYDASTTASFTVTSASAGTGSLPTITSLTPSLASPRAAETEMDIICIAADADNDPIYYRFYLTGPGTASKNKMVQDWSQKNSWHWKPLAADVGVSTITVEVRDGNHAGPGSCDATTSISYTITTASGSGSGSLPTITSLTPSLASPRGQGTEVDFICIATDADNDPIYYRFCLTGPGTVSKKKIVQDWSQKNSWKWTATKEDIGANTITVEIRDGNHAGQGSHDASTTASYTISSNTAPTINDVYCKESGTFCVGDKIHLVALASDSDGDLILYKFFRSSNGVLWEVLTDWQIESWIVYELDKTDYGALFIKAQVRDGKHAGEESFDAEISSGQISVQRASLTSVTPSLTSPKAHETTIVFSALANKTTKIYYRFWQKGPGTGSVWRDMTGWQQKNSWSWRTLACDVGTNYVRAEVCDDPDAWSDGDTTSRRIDTTYTIS